MVHSKIILLAIVSLLSLMMPIAPRPSSAIATPEHKANTAITPAVSADIELIGHVGGIVTGLAVQGRYAYIGISSELAILDMSDPGHPTRVGSVLLPARAKAVRVDGAYAYVLTTGTGLAIVDISYPSDPFVVSHTPVKAENIVVAGRYLYALSNDLHILDVSKPGTPVQVGYSPLGGGALALVGRYLYIGFGMSQSAGLRILDVANPAAPALVGEYTTQVSVPPNFVPNVSDLVVDQNDAYITFSCCVSPLNGLIVDVSNPARPKHIGSLPGTASSIAVAGQYIYMADRNILRVVDIAHPDRPRLLLAYTMPRGLYAQAIGPPTLKLAGRYLYYAAEDAVEVVDMARPNTPNIIGAYLTLTYAGSAVARGRYAYVNAAYGGLQILDLADPANPVRVGWLPGDVQELAVAGNHAYLAMNDTPSTIRVVDISVPTNPVVVGALKYDTRIFARSMTISGDYLYLADIQGLRILDISHPLAPVEVALLPGPVGSVAVAGHYAYVALNDTDNPRLEIVDVANPAAPSKVAALPMYGNDVAVMGSYAYVVANDIFRIVDISDPAAPVQVGSRSGYSSAVDIHGRYAYIGEARNLQVIDIADPANPIGATAYALPACGNCFNYPSILAVANGYVYLAQSDGGLFIFRFGKSIAGQITHANGLPALLAGVTISAGIGLTATTDLSGAYTLDNLASGAHTLAPVLAGYRFWPANRAVTISSDVHGHDFVALTSPVSVTLATGAFAVLTSTDTQGLLSRLDLPSGAVTSNTTLVFTPTIAEGTRGWTFAGHAFDLAGSQGGEPAPDLAFGAPVTVTIDYSAGDARLVSEPARLALWWWNGGGWQDAAGTCSPTASYSRDPIARRISVGICRTGRFALFGPTQQIYLPQSLSSVP